MSNQIETPEEEVACFKAMARLEESGWSLADEDDNHALRLMWMAGRDWAREQAEQEAADADELEADVRDRYEQAAALGRHLHSYYADNDDRSWELTQDLSKLPF